MSAEETTEDSRAATDCEKKRVALSSVAAAVLLTVAKIAVGLWTNSLGILSEAAHSALDLVAAVVTYLAIRVSGRPADRDHLYGHGKFENLSALFETLLLVLTCFWIAWEAVERLFFVSKHVDVNAWSFLVIALSISIDFTRSRALKRVADKYQSQALEADALHFSTDIWSSCVVLLGLVGVLISHRFERLAFLVKADALAALGVALIVLKVCYQLGRKSVDDLLDAVPEGLRQTVAEAAKVKGVLDVRQVRLRRSGPEVFADVTLAVGHGVAFEAAHDIADRAESAIQAAVPKADVVIHVEPMAERREDVLARTRILAAKHGLGAHAVRIYDEEGRRSIELHLEVGDDLKLDEAHKRADDFEKALREAVPGLAGVVTHIEPAGERASLLKAEPAGEGEIQRALLKFLKAEKIPAHLHEIQARLAGGELQVSLHCALDGSTAIQDAHDISERIEKHLRAQVPFVGRVVIHVEPVE
ncbi:MAG: cation-efflux pump [Elusimicrobia bacterium]|nr:cation-efflux pump [Elusimicrobiota bacterium]